jgi:16S rRNA (guanine966-N2)-methyltransferase
MAGARRSHEVRIIGGQYKRSKLPVAEAAGLRPTPDRVRETLFNWLGQDLSGWVCVDAFAGSGALGFEAASRGAREVRMFEHDAALAASLSAQAQRLGAQQVQVRRGDGITGLKGCAASSLDLVFIDPPYGAGLYESALAAAAPALKPAGWLYLEAAQAWDAQQCEACGYSLARHLRAGAVHAHLLQPIA